MGEGMCSSGELSDGCEKRGQVGFTLIEVLATLMLLSVSLVALLSSTLGLISLSMVHRNVVKSGIESVGVAEAVEKMGYLECPTVGQVRTALGYPQTVDEFVLDIESLQYLASGASSTATWGDRPSCLAAGDQGLLRVVVSVERPNGRGVERLVLVKRDDRCSEHSAQFTATTMAAQKC